ncbi:MAG: hypothetical protein O7D30_09240, partial [Rickettsia endosymbiont of Ixodes persulcatus]|nr:hypothetical protein [Rickettsia endosymbiont of Ixodes persulcatus]
PSAMRTCGTASLIHRSLKWTPPFPKMSFDERFADMKEQKHLITSAVCHPKFKVEWTNNKAEQKRTWNYLKNELIQISTMEKASSGEQSGDFMGAGICRVHRTCCERMSGVSQAHAAAENVFLKFNTVLPSSAAVERVVSVYEEQSVQNCDRRCQINTSTRS